MSSLIGDKTKLRGEEKRMSDKIKIKLSELSDMYDIENDSEDKKNIPDKEKITSEEEEFETYTMKIDEIE